MTYTAPFTRRNHGKGHSYRDATGQQVPGVTTILSKGLPKPALVNWAARTAAAYAINNWQQLTDLPISERLEHIRQAPNSNRDAAALRGTKLHDAAQLLQERGTADVEPEQVPLVENYLQFCADWQLQPEHIEAPVYNVTHGYAGTLDIIGTLADGQRWLLDLKTSKGVYGDMALQLAAYRYCEWLTDPDDNLGPDMRMPHVDAVGIVHVRADGYDLVPLVAGPEQFRAFLYVQQVARTADRLEEFIHPPLTRETQEITA